MKKFRNLFIVLSLVCSNALYANDLTPAQKAFQNSIMSFLREEGFSPSTDEDNNLEFKKEGELYWIGISGNSPFYIEFHRVGFSCTDANLSAVLLACNNSNKDTKCAKSYLNNNSITIVIELYCHSAEEFKYIFYKCLNELSNAYKATEQYYNEADEITENDSAPFSVSKIEVANVDKEDNVISSWDAAIYSYQSKYIKPRLTVNVNNPGTYDIYVKLFTPSGLSTGTNSPSGYSYKSSIKMESGLHTYTLGGWGNDDAGHWKEGSYRIELYYQGSLLGEKIFVVK